MGGVAFLPSLLPAGKDADVMIGAGVTILDQDVNLRMEATNRRTRQEKQETLRPAGAEPPHLDCLPSHSFMPLSLCAFL